LAFQGLVFCELFIINSRTRLVRLHHLCNLRIPARVNETFALLRCQTA